MTSEITSQTWDVIIIGTGIGGGTAGRALAQSGLKVLFVEKGPPPDNAANKPRSTRQSSCPKPVTSVAFGPVK